MEELICEVCGDLMVIYGDSEEVNIIQYKCPFCGNRKEGYFEDDEDSDSRFVSM